jgi:hypothetical protein
MSRAVSRRAFKLANPRPTNKEAAILEGVQTFLSLTGWTHLRTFPGLWCPYGEYLAALRGGAFRARPRTLHERFLPDLIAVKADPSSGIAAAGRVLWIEVKKPGERPEREQERMHERLRRAGFIVVWCDGVQAGEGSEPFIPTYDKIFSYGGK